MADAVIDASVTLAWLFEEVQAHSWIEKDVLGTIFAVPPLWRLEIVNAILIRERRRQITQSQGTEYFAIIKLLSIEIVEDSPIRSLENLASFARPHQLTAYDAVYLDLASTLGLPLYTFDKNLQDAAKRLGITLIL